MSAVYCVRLMNHRPVLLKQIIYVDNNKKLIKKIKLHMVISIDAENTLDRIQHASMIFKRKKMLKNRNGNFLNLLNGIFRRKKKVKKLGGRWGREREGGEGRGGGEREEEEKEKEQEGEKALPMR